MLYRNALLEPLINLSRLKPGGIVLQAGQESLTARELLEQSKALGVNLSNEQLREGEVVLLALQPGKEFLIVFYALMMLRAKIAIIDNEMGKEHYESRMRQLKPSWLFADSRLLFLSRFPRIKSISDKFKQNIPQLFLPDGLRIVSSGKRMPGSGSYKKLTSFFHPGCTTVELAVNTGVYECIIIYTSGTLDIPKGVVHTDFSLSETLRALEKIFIADTDVVFAAYLPHFVLLGIACNFSVKMINPGWKAKKKLRWFHKENITHYFGAPYDYLTLIEHCEKYNLKFPESFQHLLVGSAPVHKAFLKRLINVLPAHTKITCTYGMTEHLITALADGRKKILYEEEGDLLGEIAAGVTVVTDDSNEIFVHSNQLFKRYLHEVNREKMHATGDLGKSDQINNLVLLGRKKDMIIRKDFNIYPALYEDTIRKIPGIAEAALVGIYSDKAFDEEVWLVVETETLTVAEVTKKLRYGNLNIDSRAFPDKIVKMKMPRLGRHQKIDKIALVEMLKHTTY